MCFPNGVHQKRTVTCLGLFLQICWKSRDLLSAAKQAVLDAVSSLLFAAVLWHYNVRLFRDYRLKNLQFDVVFGVCFFSHETVLNYKCHDLYSGPDSSVGIATGCGLDRPGIESRWVGGEILRTHPARLRVHLPTSSVDTRVFPRGVKRQEYDVEHAPPSSPGVKERVAVIPAHRLVFHGLF